MNSRTSSGTLRNVSTYSAPSRWSQTTGATRSAATDVPTTIATANETTTRRTVTEKPDA